MDGIKLGIGIVMVVISWVIYVIMTSQLMIWIGTQPYLLELTYGGNLWKAALIFGLACVVYILGRILVED